MTYYDAEIEYIQNTDSSCIVTDYIPTGPNIKIQGKFTPISYTTAYAPWFRAYTSENADAYRIIRANTNNNGIYFTCGSKAGASGSHTISLNTTYVFEMTRNSLTLNGNSNTFTPTTGTVNTGKLTIFARDSKNSFTRGKLYYFKVYDNNVIVMDFIPVRIGSVGYMYDKVSDTLFGNAGTGSFVLGPDVAGWPGVTGKPKVSSIRRLMILLMPKHNYKQNDYIQDGLVFWLDGINKGSNEGAWTDLIGGHIYTNYGATALENGWRLYKKYLRSADCNFLPANSNQTVEIVFKPTVNSGPQAIWMQNGSGNMTTNTVLLFWNGTAATFLQHNKTYTIPLTVNAYHCVSLNLTLGLVNGVKKDPNTNNDYWNNTSDYSAIGCRNGGGTYFNGDIFAIRVYDRRLTEDEMLHNQQVDNIRFNLGLDLT